MHANRVLETCLYVDDLDAAERFYGDLLGSEPYAKMEGRHLFFRCGENMLLMFNPEKTQVRLGDFPTHGARGAGHVAFAMTKAEIPAWRERLAELDVEIEKEIEPPGGGISIYFRDPAGNSVELATPRIWGLSD